MGKLLITALLGLSLVGCAPVKKGSVFDYREKYTDCGLALEIGGGYYGTICDLNGNEKIYYLVIYDAKRPDSTVNYASEVMKFKKEITFEEWLSDTTDFTLKIDYYLFDKDGDGTLEEKAKPTKK